MQTAILIFSRTAWEEASADRYGAGRRNNLHIGQRLIAYTEDAARRSGIPVIRNYSGAQRGATFAERFANAIDDAFALGYRNLITIGTDTPGIAPASLRHIAAKLAESSFAIGPSDDGGVYAIGLSRDAWNKEEFRRIRWQTGHVQADLGAYANRIAITVQSLASLPDIDDATAFYHWLRIAGSHTPLVRCITNQLTNARPGEGMAVSFRSNFPKGEHTRRGPPLAA